MYCTAVLYCTGVIFGDISRSGTKLERRNQPWKHTAQPFSCGKSTHQPNARHLGPNQNPACHIPRQWNIGKTVAKVLSKSVQYRVVANSIRLHSFGNSYAFFFETVTIRQASHREHHLALEGRTKALHGIFLCREAQQRRCRRSYPNPPSRSLWHFDFI